MLQLQSLSVIRIIALAMVVTLSPACLANTITGRVIGVSDGDTITVLDKSNQQHIVRLAGIDAPEKSQPHGQRAKENLAKLVYGKQVILDGRKRDRYQRLVAKVNVGIIDINLEQVKSGFAWHYKEYAKEQSKLDRDNYANAHDSARQRGMGLWSDRSAIAPWDWRKTGRASHRQTQETNCPCSSKMICTGARGGKYCITPKNNKKYL
jgi:endonuclease YncB( thermonuclease family)